MKYFVLILMMLAVSGYGGKIQVAPECEGKDYCDTKPDNYDQFLGYDLDQHMEKNKYWLGASARNLPVQDLEPNFVMDSENCDYVEEVHKPYIIQVNGTKLVVQSKYLEQRIKTTKCQDKQQSCFDTLREQEDRITTECTENYSTVTLFIFENGAIKPQDFSIAVSCYCKIKFKDIGY